jgi:glycerol-3-phosphate dehydrogenase (NAD(P)+)
MGMLKQKDRNSGGTLAVIGAGAWGSALAGLQASNFSRVGVFTQEADSAEEVTRFHSNERYLDGVRLPANVLAWTSLERALEGATTAIVAVPSHASRPVARGVLALTGPRTRIVLATKGLEQGTGLLSIEVWREEIASARSRHRDPLVLSGPNLAREISLGMPAVSCLAGESAAQVGRAIQRLGHPLLTLVPFHDPVGVQAAGALKNVYAVGCGMARALEWGDNATAAMIWRGLDETERFVAALGGDPAVATTPAGVGDFVATCTSPLSRNHDLGRMISGAAGGEEVHGVREGARTAAEALRRARALGIEMPLLEAVELVMSGVRKPETVLEAACGAPRRAHAFSHGATTRGLLTVRQSMGVATE